VNTSFFSDPKKKYCVALFLESEVLERMRKDVERLGAQKNVHLTVQPCGYEAVEFLTRIAHQLIGHESNVEKELFWQALVLKSETPTDVWKRIAEHQYQYLCAILEQNAKVVEKEGKVLQSLSEYYL
jgi:hypothetical protein